MSKGSEGLNRSGRQVPDRPSNRVRGGHASAALLLAGVTLLLWLFFVSGCGVINPGKWKGIEKTAKDEKYYLVKDVFLTAGSAYLSKQTFDRNMNDSVNLFFTPTSEKNHYITESIWFDPNDSEFRTIRMTHDVQAESKQDFQRKKSGTPRVHTISTKELYDHKPGLWKVALYIDGELARRLTFTVR